MPEGGRVGKGIPGGGWKPPGWEPGPPGPLGPGGNGGNPLGGRKPGGAVRINAYCVSRKASILVQLLQWISQSKGGPSNSRGPPYILSRCCSNLLNP